MEDNIIVVGSGPAGVATTKGLLERGYKVTLLDAGKNLEPEKQDLLHKTQTTKTLSNVEPFLHYPNGKKKLKLPYGSSYIYDDTQIHFPWVIKEGYFHPSFAEGGLSNIWGSVIQAYTPQELSHWPIPCRDLTFFYNQILSWLGKYNTFNTSPHLSSQAASLKKTWETHRDNLEKNGFLFTAPSLATDFSDCQKCGLCQHGCPLGLIYHSAHHLDQLKQDFNFKYINGIVIEKFIEKNNVVEVRVKNINQTQSFSIYANRIFLACGVGLSSLIYLRSLGQHHKRIFLNDSQHFIIPCIMNTSFKNIKEEKLHTLCQLKATIYHKMVSEKSVHLQFYTFMDLYQHEIKAKVKFLYPLLKPMFNALLERLIMVQGYLDPTHSNQLSIRYYKNPEQFIINTRHSFPMSQLIRRVSRYLKNHKKDLALKPLGFLTLRSLTGQSNHLHGSLPMSNSPKEDEVDIWGKPNGFKRVHFVDGSILPLMPPGPPTLTIMANAYRIGRECPL